MTERGRQFLILAGLNVLWAPVNLAVRVATDHGMSPAVVALARWVTLAAVLNVLLRLPAFARFSRFRALTKGDRWRSVAIGACLLAPAHLLYYLGLTRGASTVGGTVLNATSPLWTGVLAFAILGERATGRRVGGIVLGFFGAWLVVFGFKRPAFGGGNGALLYVVGVVLESVASVLGTRIVRRSSGIGYVAAWTMGMIPTLLLAPFLTVGTMTLSAHGFSLAATLAVGYLVFLPGLVSFGVWYAMVERVPLSTMVVTILLQPPLSALLAWAFFGEKIELPVFVGTALVVGALGLVAGEGKTSP